MIKFDTTHLPHISAVVDRAEKLGIIGESYKRMTAMMDLMSVVCPMRWVDLVQADDFNFAHDVVGIANHLDRDTGELKDCFLPRFAA